jgi:hypothetical protein
VRSTHTSRAVRVLAVAAAAAVVSLTGCGGGGGNGDSSAAATTSAAGGDADAFRDCLKKHGVDVPDDLGQGGPAQGQPPTGGQPFGDDPKLQEAFNACRDKAPAGGFGGGRSSQAFQAYASCLRDHGVDVPDPSTSTSTLAGQSTPPPTFDRSDPDFTAANEACQALLPTSTTTTAVKP